MFEFLKRKKDDEEPRLDTRESFAKQVDDSDFQMTVDDVMTVSGRGTVALGEVQRGTVRVGDQIVISGRQGRLTARVRALEKFREIIDTAHTGDYIGVTLEGVSKEQIEQGDILLKG